MKKLTFALVCLCCSIVLMGQQELDLSKKQLQAKRLQESITIDGKLDEGAWLSANIATGFVQNQPDPGTNPSQPTEVKVLYNNKGLYVGAFMHDVQADSILKELSQRDQLANTDWFGIFIDAYRDGINGVSFIVTPSNVQFDAKYSAFGEDSNWDAVWESEVYITEEGWTAELFIPYSAIRFPDVQDQIWHLNFGRMIRRHQEKNFWSEVDPQENGFLNQAGYLMNVKDIKSPFRLQATPFFAVYAEHFYDKNGEPKNSFGRSFNGGMDIKYGITDAFTLDMTLIPDFGEAQSDNQVLNLSPFEVRFDENRQFFTEGIELFNKGGLFYSRRIGGQPMKYWDVEGQLEEGEEIVDNPVTTQLYNATKISGRTTGGLGVGFFNATAGETVATIRSSEGSEREFTTSPLTNYNVLVFDQNLKNNSYATLINTTVLRNGGDYDANVTGTVFELRNKANSYSISGKGVLSQKYFSDQTDLGHTFNIDVDKTSGNLVWGVSYNEESDTYDPNDLGFLFNNNERRVDGYIEYNQYKPFWKFNRGGVGFWNHYDRLYNPDVYAAYGLNVWGWAQTKGFWNLNYWSYHRLTATYDYFEPRVDGRFYRIPTSGNYGLNLGTDSRKRFRTSIELNYRNFGEQGRHNINWGIYPRFRVNDKLTFRLSLWNGNFKDNVGFVNHLDNADTGETDVIFGRRDQTIVENVFRTSYNFSANMALTFRMRHYWTKVKYSSFHLLGEDGRLSPTDYNDQHDTNFNAFNIDMVFRWRFAPGSDIFIVWKEAILNGQEGSLSPNYFRNLDGLFDAPQSNSLSFKIIYFLDYVNFVKDERTLE
ncbi:MAG: DUF5916 domain-containing protein [Bacteroidota bacterium]